MLLLICIRYESTGWKSSIVFLRAYQHWIELRRKMPRRFILSIWFCCAPLHPMSCAIFVLLRFEEACDMEHHIIQLLSNIIELVVVHSVHSIIQGQEINRDEGHSHAHSPCSSNELLQEMYFCKLSKWNRIRSCLAKRKIKTAPTRGYFIVTINFFRYVFV